jgi:hypothetical protein
MDSPSERLTMKVGRVTFCQPINQFTVEQRGKIALMLHQLANDLEKGAMGMADAQEMAVYLYWPIGDSEGE